MTPPSIIVIGAGTAGLSTGCYARMNGYRCQIFEHHATAGGVVTAWRRGGYSIDGGPYWLMSFREGNSAHELYREVGVLPAVKVIEAPMFMQVADERSGRAIDISKDLDLLVTRLAESVPREDVALVEAIIEGARSMQGMDMIDAVKPKELSGRLGDLRMMWKMRSQLKYFVSKFGRPVQEYLTRVKDPFTAEVLKVFYMPEVPVWFMMMLLGMLADGQLGIMPGGSRDLTRAITRRYVDLGGDITFDATVEQVIVQNHRAVGVRLADGTEHRSDAVVSAADGHSTIFDMLEGRYTDRQIEQRYRSWDLIRPTVMAAFGVSMEFDDHPWLRSILLAAPPKAGGASGGSLMVRVSSHSVDAAPPGHCVVQAAFDSSWDHWDRLRQDPAAYQEEKQAVARQVLRTLSTHYPGIEAHIQMQDVSTPVTTWRYTRNRRGAWQGWLPWPGAIQSALERTLPGLKGFCMAGQWVMPGGGVPTCILSGKQAVQILCKQAGRSFRATRG